MEEIPPWQGLLGTFWYILSPPGVDGGSCCGTPGGFSSLLPVHSSALGLVQWEVVVAAPSWVQEQGSACGLAGALPCCSAPGRCWEWSHQDCVGGLSRCYLHSTAPGQVYAGDLAAALALPPAQEAAVCSGAGAPDRALWQNPAAEDALHCLVLVAWCFCHCGDCYVPAAPLSAPTAPACMPHSSSRGFSVLWAPSGQHPLSCCLLAAQPPSRGLMCPRKALQHCQIAGDALLG